MKSSSFGGSLNHPKKSYLNKYRSPLLVGSDLLSWTPYAPAVACLECLAERRHSCSLVWSYQSPNCANKSNTNILTNHINLVAKFNAAGSWIRNFNCVLKRNSAHLSPSSSSVPLENYL